jgi:hypothetical protein
MIKGINQTVDRRREKFARQRFYEKLEAMDENENARKAFAHKPYYAADISQRR